MIQKNDILERKFNKTLRGFDPVEVRYFLEMIADEFEKLEARIIELEPIEKQLKDMKIKSPDDLIKEAEQKAQKTIADADKLASDVIGRAKLQKEKETEEITALRNKKDRLVKSLNDALGKQKDLINMLNNVTDDHAEENDQNDELL
ncbi:DivIVA domain-containing protein [bacterium]|nr:DivIVA domain-containing protein [bacterium]MBU1066024.1 DivIVA domain-containing protein [bacterium]MBU1635830.1 DivIVA domain-containing protein [bacterium]MBU1872560.1 DivIVA domain-containing protein [bacterium]